MRRHQSARTGLLVAACGLALVTAAGTAAGTALAAPAEQTPPRTTAPAALCADGNLCTWPQRDFTGELTSIGDGAPGKCYNLPRGAASAINDSGSTAVFYAAEACAGGVVVGVEPGRKTPSFGRSVSVRLRQPGTPIAPGTAPAPAGPQQGTQAPATGSSSRPSSSPAPAGSSQAPASGKSGGTSSAPASGKPSSSPAPASGKPSSSSAPASGKPSSSSAPAPASGKPSSSPAPASGKPAGSSSAPADSSAPAGGSPSSAPAAR